MKIGELLEAAIPFHIKYPLQGFDPSNPLHQQFKTAVSDRLRKFAASLGQPVTVDIPKLWKAINQQAWRSAESGQAFTVEDPPSASRKDLSRGFTTDNLQFISSSELKKLGYQSRSHKQTASLGDLAGYNASDPLHANWLEGFKKTKIRISRGNPIQGIEPAPFDVGADQAWDLINNQQWMSALSGVKFTADGETSPSLSKINKAMGWTVGNIQYITKAENHPKGAQYSHTLAGLDKTNPLHSFFVQNYAKAKARAKKTNVAFTVTAEQAWNMINNQGWRCALSGVAFDRNNQQDPLAPSLDQINPRQGYTPDNVQYLTWLVNNSKAALDNDQYKSLCKAVIDHAGGVSQDLGARPEDPYSKTDSMVQVQTGGATYTRRRAASKHTGLDLANPLHKKLRDIWKNTAYVSQSMGASPRRRSMIRELSLSDCLDKANAQDWKCALTGVYLTTSGPNMISMDRIDPDGGYTQDNIQFTTWVANRAKTDMSIDEFVELCKKVAK